MIRFIVVSILVALLFSSCGNENVFYEEYQSIPNAEWHMNESPRFEFSITDTTQKYNMFFNIRHTSAYEWENLWIITDITFPNDLVDRDTLEFMLQDGTGKWLGKGNLHDGSYRFTRPKRFPMLGKYSIRYHHAMRDTALLEITDVGFKLVKAD